MKQIISCNVILRLSQSFLPKKLNFLRQKPPPQIFPNNTERKENFQFLLKFKEFKEEDTYHSFIPQK